MSKRIVSVITIIVLTISQVLFSFPFNLPEVKEAHAATRLGLHVTQEELNCWRQRAGVDSQGSNGITCPVKYKSAGDVSTNSPGDWDRIVTRKNSFNSGTTEHWTWMVPGGSPPNSCYKQGMATPGSTRGFNIRDAAFYGLLANDAATRTNVRNELMAQAAEPSTNWANRNLFCDPSPSVPIGDGSPTLEYGEWLTRLVYAYSYVRTSAQFSNSDRSTLDLWFYNAGQFYNKVVSYNLASVFPNRLSDNYSSTPFSQTCGFEHCNTHWNCDTNSVGYQHYDFHTFWNNRNGGLMNFVGQVGILWTRDAGQTDTNSPESLINSVKRYFKEWIRFEVFADGTPSELARWESSPLAPTQGWNYTTQGLVGPMASFAEALARTGDTELMTFSDNNGTLNVSPGFGAYTTPGGPKTLDRVILQMVRFAQRRYNWQGTGSGATCSDVRYRIDDESEFVNLSYPGDTWVALPANLYYQLMLTDFCARQATRSRSSSARMDFSWHCSLR